MLLLLLLSEEPGSRSDRAIADVVAAELADELRVAFLYKSGCLAETFIIPFTPFSSFRPFLPVVCSHPLQQQQIRNCKFLHNFVRRLSIK
jgi:hypothetical protein